MEHAPCHHECTELCKLKYQDGGRQIYSHASSAMKQCQTPCQVHYIILAIIFQQGI